MRYLDPKNDLIFKRIFGEHPNILVSFLNAILPLEQEGDIISLEYLPAELVPEIPIFKNSIVDVRCKDKSGRQFIVEMQMYWTDSFKSRVLFNAAKAYVRQIEKGTEYAGLEPVYVLSIVNEDFESSTSNHYHHYKLVETEEHKLILQGLELVFVELPKFFKSLDQKNYSGKKLYVLWLRFLAELENKTEMISPELLEIPEIAQAIELTKESSYSKAELESYDKYWDIIRTQRTFVVDAENRGRAEGKAEGKAEGRAEGKAEGRAEGKAEGIIQIAKNMKSLGISVQQISAATGLDEKDINQL
jgi:predicted transposase/invertase (TIGR01784 family)